jgi:hypothetical protein
MRQPGHGPAGIGRWLPLPGGIRVSLRSPIGAGNLNLSVGPREVPQDWPGPRRVCVCETKVWKGVR